MYCRNCGKQTLGSDEYCEDCRPFNITQAKSPSEANRKKICCPKCKSRNYQIVTNTTVNSETTGGGYSASKGCCGFMAFGGLGLLCGACGSKSKTTVTSTSTNIWVCCDCGNKFRDLQEIEKDRQAAISSRKWVPISLYIFAIFVMLVSFLSTCAIGANHIESAITASLIVGLPIVIIIVVMGRVFASWLDKEIGALYEEKRNIEENGYTDE